MARYAPLPSVSIDPRNESELVQAAAQKVYEASNQTLNDFSSGNPLAVLLEGQAFAQGEFLFWANQLPDKILIEWLGPFLGAMRRLGTPSSAELVVQVPPSDRPTLIPSGSIFSTDPQRTQGQSYEFVTDREYTISSGETGIRITVYSRFLGSAYNVPSNSIVNSTFSVSPVSTVTNPQPATGGSDVETFQEVQERFFTLIRRRNPVSGEDWENFFIDLFGEGTLTSVQPGQSHLSSYPYAKGGEKLEGNVSFFVLGPEGRELTNQQMSLGQKAINYSLPVESRAFLYPITLSSVQYNIELSINSQGPYASSQERTSLDFRNRLNDILTPGSVFPADSSPSVSDVDAAFYSTFSSDQRFRDPKIESSRAFNTPNGMVSSSAIRTKVKSFTPRDYLFNEQDLVILNNPNPTFYPVESPFTPVSSRKRDQPLYGNLQLKQIKRLEPGTFSLGDIVYYGGEYSPSQEGLHVVLDNLTIESSDKVPTYFQNGKISEVKSYSPWEEGNSYQYSSSGFVNPEIVEYDYIAGDFIPSLPGDTMPLNMRPGGFAWLVTSNFSLQRATNSVSGAQEEFLIGDPVTPVKLTPGESYSSGTWVFTPVLGSGPNPQVDPFYHFVDSKKGVLSKYAFVLSDFVYNPSSLTVSDYFEDLIRDGILKDISWSEGDEGLPVFLYKSRFKPGDYIEGRRNGSPDPDFYVSSSFFTPPTSDMSELLSEGLLYPLTPTPALKNSLKSQISQGQIRNFRRLFTFMPGDRTFFREGSEVYSYTATEPVTPLFDFDLYRNSGIFVDSETVSPELLEPGQYLPFFDPENRDYAEDTIEAEDGKSFYRVMRSFIPALEVQDWSGTVVSNNVHYEEYKGNLLRYVSSYSCEEEILPQLGSSTSSLKLGRCQVTLVTASSSSTSKKTYVWEPTSGATEVPKLSWFSGSRFTTQPVNYRNGTLAL